MQVPLGKRCLLQLSLVQDLLCFAVRALAEGAAHPIQVQRKWLVPSTRLPLTQVMMALLMPVAVLSKVANPSTKKAFLESLNIKAKKIARSAKEIERKTFHVTGMWCRAASFSSLFCDVCLQICSKLQFAS
jgi:hypothetical protein